MKRTAVRGTMVGALATMLGLGLLVVGVPIKVQARHACSVATLQGEYLFTVRGDAPGYAHTGGSPVVAAGVRTFDGAGNFSQVATVSMGGTIISRDPLEGVYTLDADCTGTMTVAGTRHFDVFMSKDGSEGFAIQTDNGTIAIQTLKKATAAPTRRGSGEEQ